LAQPSQGAKRRPQTLITKENDDAQVRCQPDDALQRARLPRPLRAAAKAGFKAVEFLFPYAYPAAEIKSRLDANGLQLVLHNLPAGNWDAGDRGIACRPGAGR
jgi:hypothetical protein